MHQEIRTYPVQNPVLKKYIRFFWEIRIEHMQLNHKLIPQRNINLRFNLSETPQYVHMNGTDHLLEDVYFLGLQDSYRDAYLKTEGKIDMIGVCFYPESFYPFSQIPLSEFKNQVLGAHDIGLKTSNCITEQLKETPDIFARLTILENKLASLLIQNGQLPEDFRRIFNVLKQSDTHQIHEFCIQNNIGARRLERMYNKYVGISANTYGTLNRFHSSLNQLIYNKYEKLSDLAYDNGYFDQTHFIKEFKRFAGNTPKNFVHQNNSILQVGKLT
jgi:AraC-like DNA-binding protein